MNTATPTFQTSKKPAAAPISSSLSLLRSGNLLQRKCACGGTPGPTGECEECRKKRLSLQRKALNSELGSHKGSSVPPIVHEVLCSSGQPLDPPTRAFMEPRFGHDFSRVRVHSDARAAASARAVSALAYTVGSHVVFGASQYLPITRAGQRLIAHELAHTIQQSTDDRAGGEPLWISTADDAEKQADGAASAVIFGKVAPGLMRSSVSVARQMDSGPTDASLPGGSPDTTESPDAGGDTGAVAVGAAAGSPVHLTKVCSKRLQAPGLGLLFNHAYIDDTGRGDCLGKGMAGNYAVQDLVPGSGNFLRGCATKTATSSDPQTYTPNVKQCDPKPGVTDLSKCLRDAYNSYADPSLYQNLPVENGPNSNTFAATLAKTCCADDSSAGLGLVPGWDHVPAPPCPSAPAPAPGVFQPSPPPPGSQQSGPSDGGESGGGGSSESY